MKRMEARGTWTLFRANETPDLHHLYGKKFEEAYPPLREARRGRQDPGPTRSRPSSLWKKMLSMLFETRPPVDHLQGSLQRPLPAGPRRRHPLQQPLHGDHAQHLERRGPPSATSAPSSSTPTSSPTAPSTTRSCVTPSTSPSARWDNVIDINFYPTAAAKTSNMRHRPIGLGVMGLANSLYMKGIPFASQEAVEFNDEFMEAIAYYAYESSSDPRGRARAPTPATRARSGDRGLLPPDTVALPRPGTRPAHPRCRPAARWTGRPSARRFAKKRHAEQQRPRPSPPPRRSRTSRTRPPCIEADLQEPLRQIQPLRRVRRP